MSEAGNEEEYIFFEFCEDLLDVTTFFAKHDKIAFYKSYYIYFYVCIYIIN